MIPILLASLFTLAASHSASLPHPVTIPFEYDNRTIFVRTEVGRGSFWFVLDTGAGASLMDLDAARRAGIELGDSVGVVGAGRDTVQARLIRMGSAHLAGLESAEQPLLLAMPLGSLADVSGHEFAGILGSNFIRRFVVEIDYTKHVLILRDTTQYEYHGHGAVLPLTFSSPGFPQVTARVIDRGRALPPGAFTLDIGSGAALILHAPFVEQAGLLASARPTLPWVEGRGLGGDSDGLVGRVGALEIGPWRIDRPVTVFSRARSGAFTTRESQGNLGAAILEKFDVILDYPHGRVILEPNRRFAEPLEYNRSGLSLVSAGPQYRIVRVAEVADRSPAAEAGLLPGDRIVSVDGRAAESTTLSRIRMTLQRETRCRIEIERGSTRSVRTLELRRRI